MNDVGKELLDIVDESNVLTGVTKPRSLVHATKADWHRTTVIWIINGQREVLCQQRSLAKDQQPGEWQSYFGGHLKAGQTYEQNALEELREELGIQVAGPELVPLYIRKVVEGPHFAQVYILRWDGNLATLKFNDGEVMQVQWVPLGKLKQLTTEGKFCNRFDQRVAGYIG